MKLFIVFVSAFISANVSALTISETSELLSNTQTQAALQDIQVYKIKEIGPRSRAAARFFEGTSNEIRVNYRALLVCGTYVTDKVYHVTAIIPSDLVYITPVHKIVKQTSLTPDAACQAQAL